MAFWGIRGTIGEDDEPAIEQRLDRVGVEVANPGSGELDRQRQPVHLATDIGDGPDVLGGQDEGRVGLHCPLGEEANSIRR